MTPDTLSHTLRSNFPGYLGKAMSLATDRWLAECRITGATGECPNMEIRNQVELSLLCDLSRNESYDFAYRELQHNLGLTADQMTWQKIFRACKIKKPESGTCTRAEAMKMCLQASLEIAAERNKTCQHTFLDSEHSDRKVVDPHRDISLRMWLFIFCVVAVSVSLPVSVFLLYARVYWLQFG